MDREKVAAKLKTALTPPRFDHTLRVAQLAWELAVRFNVDPDRAYLAGLLHDYARDMDNGALLLLGQENKLIQHQVELKVPALLHGPAGAFLVARDLAVDDREVLAAIRFHTTGRPDMGELEQIIYVADAWEPGRDFPGWQKLNGDLEQVTELGHKVELTLARSLIYVINKGGLVHPLTVEALNRFRDISGK